MSANTLSWIILTVSLILLFAALLRFGGSILRRGGALLDIGAPKFPTPMKRPWAITAAIFLGLSWIPIIILADLLIASGTLSFLFPTTLSSWEIQSPVRLLLGIPFCLLIAPILLRVNRKDYSAFLKASGVTEFRKNGVLLSWIMMVSTILLSGLFSAEGSQGSFTQMFNALYPFSESWIWLSDVQPPLYEELLYRGVILGLLLKYTKPWQAVGITSLLFGSIHYITGGLFPFLWSTFTSLFLFSGLRLITGTIWASVFSHFVNNNAASSFTPLAMAFLITVISAFILGHRREKHTDNTNYLST